jgi:hypothetical protein
MVARNRSHTAVTAVYVSLLPARGEDLMSSFYRSVSRARLTLCSLALFMLASFVCVAPTSAANPSLGSLAPLGAQRGTEVEVTFNGARLGDAKDLLLYYPGITVAEIKAEGETKVKAKLKIAPDCRLGIHAFRIRTATGLTNLRTFNVGPLTEITEKEPNNDFAVPQKIDLDVTVNGSIGNEDVDYFQIDAKKGERITVEVEGIRLGAAFFDPYVAIQTQDRKVLSDCDDLALVWQDGVASSIAPEDGTYIVQVRDSSFSASGSYRLHVGRFPRPTAVIPSGGKLGESLTVRWLGDAAGERSQQITLPGQESRLFGVFCQDERGISPSPNSFRISDLGNVLEAEPNNDAKTATSFEAPMALGGVIGEKDDVDCFKFKCTKGTVYDVRVFARQIRSELDSVLTIDRVSNGARVGSNDDTGGSDSYLKFSAPADDEYIIKINDHGNRGGVDYAYRVEIAPSKPALTLGLPERQQYVDVTVSVPQGNRTAIMVSASRRDFNGDLNLDVKDMPAGMTVQALPMAGNQQATPVIFTAPAGTPLAGSLADVVALTADPKLGVTGHMEQITGLVRGQNNNIFWPHRADRMALAVTDEAPFKIEVVQPKVPLVRSGSMELKVVATRKEGFAAPINIRMLYNPSGIGSSTSTTIAEGKTEGFLPLTANANAEIRKWPVVVMGEATVGDGPVLISSQLFDLEVVEPYLGFAFKAAAVDLGQETEMVIGVTANKEFAGAAKVQLLGLPFEATTEPQEITKETTELVFKIKTTDKSPVGRHKNLLCSAVLMVDGEPVAHTLGSGELRIDKPLPPKPAAVAKPAQPVLTQPQPVAQKPVEKRLSRLELLRLEREKAKQTGDQKSDAKN